MTLDEKRRLLYKAQQDTFKIIEDLKLSVEAEEEIKLRVVKAYTVVLEAMRLGYARPV